MSSSSWRLLKFVFVAIFTLAPLAQASLATGAETVSEARTFQAWFHRNGPPIRDEVDIARRFRYPCGRLLSETVPWDISEPIGEKKEFWVLDEPRRRYSRVTATVRHTSEHLLMYVQDGISVPFRSLFGSTRVFEEQTLPALERTFGSLPTGLRLTIFNGRVPGVGGYFASSDLLPAEVNPFSNERPILYINTDVMMVGTDAYDSVLAHELQHLIHFLIHPQQDAWINEGAAELAMAVAGYIPRGAVNAFVKQPAIQLDSWASRPTTALPHYGAAYLFLSYVWERLGGAETLRDLIAAEGIGLALIHTYLGQRGADLTVTTLFQDWIVANVLNAKMSGSGGRYGYHGWKGHIEPKLVWRSYPRQLLVRATQFAGQYIDLRPPDDEPGILEISFQGVSSIPLVGAPVYQGSGMWWSQPADNSEGTLTHHLDLRDLPSATLEFATWFDLEYGYDYAYVGISTDNGCTWETVPGKWTTTYNPVGHNLGHGYTGRSGAGRDPQWVEETMDLTSYVGREVQLRFHHITDQAYHGAGILIDNIRVPEIEFIDGAENEAAGWVRDGFVRSKNTVPQRWSVQAVVFEEEGVSVVPMPLLSENTGVNGTFNVSTDGLDRIILVIAPMTSTQGQPGLATVDAIFTSDPGLPFP